MIKPAFEALQPYNEYSFLVRKFAEVEFTAPYHFHPEYELTLILKGEGKRYVGSHMAHYTMGDLVLIGSNLPHCWKTEGVIKNEINACSIVIQFSHDFLGNDFWNNAEISPFLQLLKKSCHGIQFSKDTAIEVERKAQYIFDEQDAFKRLILLLEIFYILVNTNDYKILNFHPINPEQSPAERERTSAVLAYIVNNFKEEISLQQAASIAKMSPNAFCKYYKRITRKTFIETVTEFRINYAVQLLIQMDKPISEVCFDSGFKDVSHFHKTFKKAMKMSPVNYRKKFLKNVM